MTPDCTLQLVEGIPCRTLMTYHVELALDGELFIEADKDDLETVLAHVQEHVAQNGLIVFLAPVITEGEDQDAEPTSIKDLNLSEQSIEWNPYSEFAAGRN